jgi:hypothetical protein
VNADPDPDPKILMTRNWEKITAEIKFNIFFIKNYNLLLRGLLYRKLKLQKKPSALKREHPARENMKFLNFFLFLLVIFALLDPDSESRSGSTDIIESGFATLLGTDTFNFMPRQTTYRI